MEKISSYLIEAKLESLKDGFKMGRVPDGLHDPMQALLPRVTRAVADAPTSIYLFSNEENAELRDFFGYALVNALTQHVPSALLVDCTFLDVGMNGIVPQKDALGFLDLLLYGSSLGVITQETNGGVHVVSAGSFPVTKKMPFVLNSFYEASRRLVAHSRCAVYVGPIYNDEGDLHPLIGAADLPILVRAVGSATDNTIDPIEEQIASQWNKELFSVRIAPVQQPTETAAVPEVPAPAKTQTPRAEDLEPSLEDPEPAGEPDFEEFVPPVAPPPAVPTEPTDSKQPPTVQTEPPPTVEAGPPPVIDLGEEPLATYSEKRYSSLLPKVATGVIAAFVVVFIVWWIYTERNGGGDASPTAGQETKPPAETVEVATPGAGTEIEGGTEGTPTDTAATAATEGGQTTAQPGDEGQQTVDAGPDETTATATQTAETGTEETAPPSDRRIDSRNILVMDDLESNWSDWYFIHISSFRESDKARTEVANLERRGFPVFIVFLNLGAKGSWYRVYAGPLKTRDDARNMKKLLDDSPGVRFTRITRI